MPQGEERTGFVPILIYVSLIATCVIAAARIIARGFLPDDDILADAAKAITGRPWTEILVLRPEFSSDPHVAWHALLRSVELMTGLQQRGLVVLAVIALFTLFCCAGIPWLRRAESWLLALVIAAGASTGIIERFVRGRPFIISAVCLATLLLFWRRFADRPPAPRHLVTIAVIMTVSALLHGSWYLWLLPIAAFALAGEYAWSRAIAVAWVIGCVVAALLSGHPLAFPLTTIRMGFAAFGRATTRQSLVAEFQPTQANVTGLMLIGFVVLFHKLCEEGRAMRPLRHDPAFILACLGWVLGYEATRFWVDWGLVALVVLIAVQIDAFLSARVPAGSERRLWLALGICVSFYLVATNDAQDRWSTSGNVYRTAFSRAAVRSMMPSGNGIIYSADMAVFYEGFFANPKAPWRYMTGFEPTMMPPADYAVYRQIIASHGDPAVYAPWAARMGPDDRIVLRAPEQPQLAGVDWQGIAGFWVGRRH